MTMAVALLVLPLSPPPASVGTDGVAPVPGTGVRARECMKRRSKRPTKWDLLPLEKKEQRCRELNDVADSMAPERPGSLAWKFLYDRELIVQGDENGDVVVTGPLRWHRWDPNTMTDDSGSFILLKDADDFRRYRRELLGIWWAKCGPPATVN